MWGRPVISVNLAARSTAGRAEVHTRFTPKRPRRDRQEARILASNARMERRTGSGLMAWRQRYTKQATVGQPRRQCASIQAFPNFCVRHNRAEISRTRGSSMGEVTYSTLYRNSTEVHQRMPASTRSVGAISVTIIVIQLQFHTMEANRKIGGRNGIAVSSMRSCPYR